jgi:BON domain-containing protein
MRLIKLLVVSLLAASCASEGNHAYVATTPGTATVTTSQNLDFALLAVQRGETGPWSVDGFYCERGDAGVLIIARDSGWRSLREPVAGFDTGIVTANVVARLQSDPVTRSESIRIECDDSGLCSLAGHVPSVFAAHRAIEDTMAIPGVRVVESHLTF